MIPRSWIIQASSLIEVTRLTLEHDRCCAFLGRLLFSFGRRRVGQRIGWIESARNANRKMLIGRSICCLFARATRSLPSWSLILLRLHGNWGALFRFRMVIRGKWAHFWSSWTSWILAPLLRGWALLLSKPLDWILDRSLCLLRGQSLVVSGYRR